jgi:hypothetical protein
MQALGSIPLLLLFTVRDHAWVVLRHPAPDQARYGAALDGINKGILTGRDNPLRHRLSAVALGDGADGSECLSQARRRCGNGGSHAALAAMQSPQGMKNFARRRHLM